MNKKFRCRVEHIRTASTNGVPKKYKFKVGKVYKVEKRYKNFYTIYHGKKQFSVSALFLKNKFIDEDIVQIAIRRDKLIDQILNDE
jgi:hypothetical protein